MATDPLTAVFQIHPAIAVKAIEGWTSKHFAAALNEIGIGGDKIFTTFRIPPKKMGIAFRDRDLLLDFLDHYRTINLSGHNLIVEPYRCQGVRIRMSEVPPNVPNSVLSKALFDGQGLCTNSPIFTETPEEQQAAGRRIPNREIYIHPSGIPKLPPKINLSYGNIRYDIPISYGPIKCFLCVIESNIVLQNENETAGGEVAATPVTVADRVVPC